MRAETLHRNAAHRDPGHPDPGAPSCAACAAAAAAYPPAPPLRTEVVGGLEFEVPTWDPAPTPWLAQGSWVDEPGTTARLLRGIRAAVPDADELAEAAEWARGDGTCLTFWGSHGCSLSRGHGGLCVCGAPGDPCSAVLPWTGVGGSSGACVLWWGPALRLSSHSWRWFR